MTIVRRCRVCLCGDRRMYAISNTIFQEIWEKLTNFKFKTNDGKPLIVCYICCAHLSKTHNLMKRALKAEELLTALIENVPEESQNKILLLASKTHDLAYKYLVKELYQLECNLLETNTVEEIKHEDEGGREKVNGEENYFNIKVEEEDSHHEDDLDVTDVESDTPLDDDTLLQKMLETECRIVLEKIDMRAPVIEHKLDEVPETKEEVNLETIEDPNPSPNADLKIQPDNNNKVLNISFFKKISVHSNVDVSNSKQIINPTVNNCQVNHIPKHIKIQAKNMILQHNKTIASKVYYSAENEVLKQCRPKSVVVVAPISTLNRSEEGNKSNCDNRNESENDCSPHTFQYQTVTKTEFSGEKPYTCHFCDYRCAKMYQLNNHIKYKHIKEKKFSCDTCDYRCVKKSELRKHLFRHTGEKPYMCYLCDYRSTQKHQLKVHMIFKHTKEKSFSCDRCDYKCVMRSTLIRHIRKHTGEKPYTCDLCDFKCSESGNLVNHVMSKHTKEKKYTCDICEHKCLKKDKLIAHIRKHTGEKPYKCDLCDVRCSKKCHLLRHIQYIHTKERNFSCDTCQHKFVTKSGLKRHLYIHTGDKPYICDVCGFRCVDKSNLRVHITTKHIIKKIKKKKIK